METTTGHEAIASAIGILRRDGAADDDLANWFADVLRVNAGACLAAERDRIRDEIGTIMAKAERGGARYTVISSRPDGSTVLRTMWGHVMNDVMRALDPAPLPCRCGAEACVCEDGGRWAAHCTRCERGIGEPNAYDPCAESRDEAVRMWDDMQKEADA